MGAGPVASSAVAEDPEHQPPQLGGHKESGRPAALGVMDMSPEPGWR